MTEKKAFLCVGGPYDGKRYSSETLSFAVSISPKLSMARFATDPPSLMTIEKVVYVADRIHIDKDVAVWFWRPANQSLEVTMKLLFERYERAGNLNWDKDPYE